MKQSLQNKYFGRTVGMSSMDLDLDLQATKSAYETNSKLIKESADRDEKLLLSESVLNESTFLKESTDTLFNVYESIISKFDADAQTKLCEAFETIENIIADKAITLTEDIDVEAETKLLTESKVDKKQSPNRTSRRISRQLKSACEELNSGSILSESGTVSADAADALLLTGITKSLHDTKFESMDELSESIIKSIKSLEADDKFKVAGSLREAYGKFISEECVSYESRLSSSDYLTV